MVIAAVAGMALIKEARFALLARLAAGLAQGRYSIVAVTAGSRDLIGVIFLFQAEDGIRDHCVTGVQTCALPIYFAALETSARSRDFTPISLGARARFHVATEVRRVESRNVVAKLAGSDPKLRDECVIYSAHWDHLGRSDATTGDTIFNGAVDNASGTAGLLEIAGAMRRGPAPKRTVFFLSVTSEEKGLLGSKWYAAHPLVPLEKTLADINMDSLNPWGKTSDVICVGYGQSTLDETLVSLAAEQNRSVKPDPQPEKGSYYRSDHFEFAKVGVPALYADSGVDFLGKPPGWGIAKGDDFTAHDYHQPSDEVKPDWDLSGAAQDLALLLRVGRTLADGDRWPEWKEGSEFRARREKMLHGNR